MLGAVALSVTKGGTLHRRSGLLLVSAMVVMGLSAALLGNLSGGLLAVYFVVTALTTVRPASPWTRRIDVGALAVAVGFTLAALLGGVKALDSPRGALDGVPYPMFFFLATVTTLAAAGELRRAA